MKVRLAQEIAPVRLFASISLVAACGLIAIASSACSQAAAAAQAQSQIERGKKLVIGGACHDRHTPKKFRPNGPELDMDRMLSGHPEDIEVGAPYRPAPGPTASPPTSPRGAARGACPSRRI